MTTPKQSTEYSPTPRPRKGNRRVSSGTEHTEKEPRLAGLFPPPTGDENSAQEISHQNRRDTWLKEQKPPHHGGS